jgi:hypothetical protein
MRLGWLKGPVVSVVELVELVDMLGRLAHADRKLTVKIKEKDFWYLRTSLYINLGIRLKVIWVIVFCNVFKRVRLMMLSGNITLS